MDCLLRLKRTDRRVILLLLLIPVLLVTILPKESERLEWSSSSFSGDSGRTSAELKRLTSHFTLSGFRYGWEAEDKAGDVAGLGGERDVLQCLGDAKLGRPVRILLIGDSRARFLYYGIESLLHLMDDKDYHTKWRENFTLSELDRKRLAFKLCPVGASTPLDLQDDLNLLCRYQAKSEYMEAQVHWSNYLTTPYQKNLHRLLQQCKIGECPDLVVLTGGIWYVLSTEMHKFNAAHQALKFRRDLDQLLPQLRELASVTRVLYKLDEPERLEFKGKKSTYIGIVASIHQLIYELFQKTGVQVWSSGLPISLRFYHTVCIPLGRDAKATKWNRVRLECSDKNHEAKTVTHQHVAMIMSYLCARTTANAAH